MRILAVPLAAVALAQAQRISPMPACAISPQDGTYPATPLTYPLTSDRYGVQYSVNGGTMTTAKVYISRYGATDSSPFRNDSGYVADTSTSFVSIPAQASATAVIKITKLWDAPFLASDQVSVRPSPKQISATLQPDGSVQITRNTGAQFNGEQFLLWWNRTGEGGSSEGL